MEESHDWPNILRSGHTVYISFSTSASILKTSGIEKVLLIAEAKFEPELPRKVSSSKSGAFSLANRSSFSHGTLIGLLPVAIVTIRRFFLQRCCNVLSYSGLKKRWLQMVINTSSTYYPVAKEIFFRSEIERDA